jgi:hypothetical protein
MSAPVCASLPNHNGLYVVSIPTVEFVAGMLFCFPQSNLTCSYTINILAFLVRNNGEVTMVKLSV